MWAAAGCKDEGSCSDEILIAVELHTTIPAGLNITRVTAELKSEEDCGLFIDPNAGHVYTCWEQGGGTYTIRFYSGDDVVYMEDDEVEAGACHIKERVMSDVDLSKQ
jgi:hypothetical protein